MELPKSILESHLTDIICIGLLLGFKERLSYSSSHLTYLVHCPDDTDFNLTMFSTLIKHQFPRASTFQITRLSRAGVHAKTPPNIKAHEECALYLSQHNLYKQLTSDLTVYVATTFPDDFEASPLKPEDLQKMDQAKENEPPAAFDKVGDLGLSPSYQMLIDC